MATKTKEKKATKQTNYHGQHKDKLWCQFKASDDLRKKILRYMVEHDITNFGSIAELAIKKLVVQLFFLGRYVPRMKVGGNMRKEKNSDMHNVCKKKHYLEAIRIASKLLRLVEKIQKETMVKKDEAWALRNCEAMLDSLDMYLDIASNDSKDQLNQNLKGQKLLRFFVA